jgi:CubicO group peptidase (beta-lactamase class C family)
MSRPLRAALRAASLVAFVTLVAIVSAAPDSHAQESPDAVRARVETTIEAARVRLHVPGVSVAVAVDGKIAWARGFGVKRADGADPVDADTLFQAASISKPVAASAALRLVDEGKLALDRPVNELLTSWQLPDSKVAKAEQVTLRRLLCHGAGLSVHGFAGYLAHQEVPQLQDVLEGAKPANSAPIVIEIPPGTKMQYSGGGYCVVQQLVLDATGESFPQVMRRLVLQPLAMEQSSYEQPLPAARRKQAALGHREIPVKPVAGDGFATYPEMAAAGLWTTPSDLCRFALAIQDVLAGRRTDFLKPESAREMVTPQVSGEIGLGLFLQGKGPLAKDGSAGPSLYFGHDGANEGFRCILLACREARLAVAVMTNSDGGSPLGNEIVTLVKTEYGWPTEPHQ